MKVLLDEDGIIYFADIKGDCPKCGGQLKLCRNENTYKVYGICNRNRDHKYKFDHTRFIGTEVE
jgi:ssDNA-binding Zn-finger/Zn-ribbon topoisomerase 1